MHKLSGRGTEWSGEWISCSGGQDLRKNGLVLDKELEERGAGWSGEEIKNGVASVAIGQSI